MEATAHIGIREAISMIQENAYAAMDMTLYDVTQYYAGERRRIADMMAAAPDYLLSRSDILAADPSLDYIALDLPGRFDQTIEGLPYQNPYLYSWLLDCLRYCDEKLWGQGAQRLPFIVATAPTGRFDAIALRGSPDNGILIEDGLLNVATQFSNTLALILYDKGVGSTYIERSDEAMLSAMDEDDRLVGHLARTIWEYVVDGYSFLPGVMSKSAYDDEDHAIRHVLSLGFLFFVFEHERYHLDWWQQGNDGSVFEASGRDMWERCKDHIADVLPTMTAEAFCRLHATHGEELLADFHAFNAVTVLGQKEGTYAASITGALMFFMIADMVQYVCFRLQEPEFIGRLYTLDGQLLSLVAILTAESHPYAFLRKCSIASEIGRLLPAHLDTLLSVDRKLDLVAQSVKVALDNMVAAAPAPPVPHAKWAFGKSLTGF
ncbi:hypothetical protein [Taibaiella koreensis]|uniref:hypothetical protein n=1 Tax=Taibaiella koreensis TaxID=1268548 RepID=UPI000E59EABF|nr:hypothetical protein [Taibaiella koreensis]